METRNYFTSEEIECKCGCGFKEVQPLFLSKMNDLRIAFGNPLTVTSCCRCEVHNKKEGGSKTSSHLKGAAVDIYTPTELFQYKLLYAAGQVGFRGIGVSKTFIHFDYDMAKSFIRFWTY